MVKREVEPSLSSDRQPTVLVVDDTFERLELLATLLRRVGYRVLTARDGREGFEVARSERPDMIISDVAMPRVDGLELCRMVRSHRELGIMPILLVSAARKDSASIAEGLRKGAFDYLEVPYDPRQLLAKVERLVELSETERALQESEERYRDLVENARDIIYTHDTTGQFTSVNSAVEEITGYTREEALTMNIASVIAPEFIEDAIKMVKAKLAGGGTTTYELEIIAKDGSRKALEIKSRPIYEKGSVVGIQGVARDITERKRAEETLREKEEQLRRSQKLEAVGRLAGGIAHDFNNLLTIILGHSDLMLRNFSEDDPMRRRTAKVKDAATRAVSLTRQLLAFSRKQTLQPEIIDLNSSVTEISEMLRRLIGENIKLVTVLNTKLGRINVDPGQIGQVLMNLAVNARDALPHGGKIVIETDNIELDEPYADIHVTIQPGQYVMLAVSDNGTGMDAETQKHIFEPFFTTKDVGRGTGLGLATVYGIVKQSGGYIWMNSQPGVGTTFKIYLPRVKDEGEPSKVNGERAESPKGKETILLVEDEAMVRELACNILEEHGYKVLMAANGEEALDICKHQDTQIHLLLTDVVMPGMSGSKLADRVALLHPETRFLYMSGYTDDAIIHHGVLDSDKLFLAKPFTSDALARKVREILDAK